MALSPLEPAECGFLWVFSDIFIKYVNTYYINKNIENRQETSR